jgi:hypothetical protein
MFWQIVEGVVVGALLAIYILERGWLNAPQALAVFCIALALLIVVLPYANKLIDNFFKGN